MALFSEYRFKCLSRKHVMHVFHTVLTFAVTLALFIYDTDLQHAMESGRLGAPIVFVFLVIFSLALFFAVSLKDPGFVQVDEEYSSKEEEELICDGDSSATTTSSKTVTHSLRRRRCGHCEILQPLRARHCMECGHCVRRFDHHCPWLDTCVGEGNHALFVFFLTFQLVTATWALALAWFVTKDDSLIFASYFSTLHDIVAESGFIPPPDSQFGGDWASRTGDAKPPENKLPSGGVLCMLDVSAVC